MDQTQSTQAALTQVQQRRTDIAVVSAMGLVAIAISVALGLHFGLSMSRAGVAGVLIFALLAGAHFLLVPRADAKQDVTELEDEELWRALKEQRRNAPDAKRIAMATRGEVAEPTPEAAPGAAEPVTSEAALTGPGPTAPTLQTEPTAANQTQTGSEHVEGADAEPSPVAQHHVPRRKSRIISNTVPAAANELGATDAIAAQAPGAADLRGPLDAPVHAASDDHADGADPETYWSYRPSNDAVVTEPEFETAHSRPPVLHDPVLDAPTPGEQVVAASSPGQPATAGHGVHAGEAQAQQPSESDVELVQSMIKKLAHQVNAREVLDQATPVIEAPSLPETPAQSVQPPAVPTHVEPVEPAMADTPQIIAQSAPPQTTPPPSSPAAVDLVTASVGALRNTADAMREADDAAPSDVPQVNQPLRPAARRDAGEVAHAISTVLAAGQVGVLLEPIVALNGMRPDHYEVSLQISSNGPADLESADVEAELQATAVLPEVDRERFIKTINVGELLRARGKAGSLLTRIYRESLLDRDFCFAVATNGVANEALAHQMVLTLSQDAVRALTASEWQTLSEFHELGYRFAISHISDLDMDFAQLTAAGFSFVKLSAPAFLAGFLDGEGTITPQELSRYLAHVGLTAIVDGLETVEQSAEVLAMGVGLGQGPVTGGSRLLKTEAVVRDDHAVA